MPLDVERDARLLRRAVAVASVLALIAVAVVGLHELGRGRATSIVELQACDGGPDRCASCHSETLAAAKADARPDANAGSATIALEHRSHDLERIGCSCCHGGTPRALVAQAAHSWTGREGRDSRMRAPGIQESCARCHAAGVRGSEHLQRGASLYLGLGCALCHGGRTNDVALAGPKLQLLTRQNAHELEEKLFNQTSGSVMPSFRDSLGSDPQATADLVLFVQSLALPLAASSREPLVAMSCTTCHVGVGGKAQGHYAHRCPSLAKLACSSCHAGAIQESARECPRVARERPACGVCHEDAL